MWSWLSNKNAANDPNRDLPLGAVSTHGLSKHANSVSARLLEPERTVFRLTKEIYCFVYGKTLKKRISGTYIPKLKGKPCLRSQVRIREDLANSGKLDCVKGLRGFQGFLS